MDAMNLPRHALRRLLPRVATGMVAALLLYAGLTGNPAPEWFPGIDKLYHMAGFAVLAMCMRLAFVDGRTGVQVTCMLALGAGIETVQAFIPGATASLWDFLADAIGTGLGLLAMQLPLLRRCGAWIMAP